MPRIASIQFISCDVAIRLNVWGGFAVLSANDFGNSRGLFPYVSCISLPLLPT